MTKYYTNFEDSNVGSAALGWTALWDASTTPANHTFIPRHGTPLVKRRETRLWSANNTRALFSFNATDADAHTDNVEILTLVKRTQGTDTGSQFIELWARTQGPTATFGGYRALLCFGDSSAPNQLFVSRFNSGAATATPINGAAFTFDATKAYWVRFRLNGTSTVTVQLKLWAGGTDEPTAWTATGSDTPGGSALGTGAVGANVSGSAAGACTVNFFSVGTNGDTAWKPRTNAEFDAWTGLADAERRFLVEMQFTGYDSSGSPYNTPRSVYIANGGFDSEPWDSPPNRFYPSWVKKLPNFSDELPTAFNGEAESGFGTLVVSNPANSLTGPGARDDWLRVKWRRNFIRVYWGDPSWPKHDFRFFLVGRVGQPTASDTNEIVFPISDLTELLKQPLQTNRYSSSAARPNTPKPVAVAQPQWMELVPTTVGALEYQAHDGAVISAGDIYDDGVSLQKGIAVTSWDATTDTLTVAAGHGGAVNSRVLFPPFPATAPPPGIARGFHYIIASGLGVNTFKLAATLGGAAEDITGTGSGSIGAAVYNWWEDLANGKITLTSNPIGRVMARQARTATDPYPARILEYLAFTKFTGLGNNFKDQAAIDAAAAVTWNSRFPNAAAVFYDEVSVLDALDRVAKATNFWYGFTRDGLLQFGRSDLPIGTPVLYLTQGDVTDLKLLKVLLPVNQATLAVRHSPRFVLNGQLQIAPATTKNAELFTMYDTNLGSAYGSPGIPLDSHPEIADLQDLAPFETWLNDSAGDERDRLQNFYGLPIGVFSFRTRYSALRQSVAKGAVLSLTHPREGWQYYDGTILKTSPDTSNQFDARVATIVSINVNPSSNSPMPVTVTVFRQIPGYYPTADLT